MKYGTWVRALFSVNSEVPSHAAGVTACDPHVPMPAYPQPCLITALVESTCLQLNTPKINKEHFILTSRHNFQY